MVKANDYPQDGSDCCCREPEPDAYCKERCPACKHFLTFIYDKDPSDGALNCTWPGCPTNAA
jgi:hypothetical protein